jgi:hypothetical protein
MIDDPTTVAKLMLQMEEYLPISASLTSATARHLRAQELRISAVHPASILRRRRGLDYV